MQTGLTNLPAVIRLFNVGDHRYYEFKCDYCGKVKVRKITNEMSKPRSHLFCTTLCAGKFNSQNKLLEKQMAGVRRYRSDRRF